MQGNAMQIDGRFAHRLDRRERAAGEGLASFGALA